MKKKSYNIVILMILVCLVLSFSLFTIKMMPKDNKESNPNNDTNVNKDYFNYKDSFEVSDGYNNKISTVDIRSKQYDNNVISIRDTNFKISDDLLNELYDIVNNYGAASSFYIVSLNDGMSIGYNVDKPFETASSIKAPYALYVYREIANGNIDPDRKIVYEPKYYNSGTGVVKESEFGTPFTVRQLVYHSINDSDNVAHTMLHYNFGVNGYNQMLKNLGTEQLYLSASNPWGFTSSRSAALIWQDAYNFSLESEEGITLMNVFCNAKYNYFKEIMPDIPSASKTGFARRDALETGIVFDENPYIAIAIANKGGNYGSYTQLLKLIIGMNDIMNEYNEYLKQ